MGIKVVCKNETSDYMMKGVILLYYRVTVKEDKLNRISLVRIQTKRDEEEVSKRSCYQIKIEKDYWTKYKQNWTVHQRRC